MICDCRLERRIRFINRLDGASATTYRISSLNQLKVVVVGYLCLINVIGGCNEVVLIRAHLSSVRVF